MATLYFTQENNILSTESNEMTYVKEEAYEQEQLASPHSTEYTDDNCETLSEIKRSTSESQKIFENFINEEEDTEDEVKVKEEEKQPKRADWNEKKDKILKNLASKCKYDWKKIAKKFNTNENTEWTALELKQKYKDLNKVVIPLRVKFTHQEDLMIAKYFDQYGCDWSQIATHFTDRTAMMLKNRYYSHIRKRDLLSTMLDEVHGKTSVKTEEEEEFTYSPIETKAESIEETQVKVESFPVKIEAKVEAEIEEFDFSFLSGNDLINFNIFNFNNPFLEFEDSFQNVLYDRITDY